MTFKEMNEFIRYILLYYRVNEKIFRIEEEQAAYNHPMHDLIKHALSLLDKEEQRMISNEFLSNNKTWWYEYYSRSTFYRLKKSTMIHFIEIINHIL